MRKHIRLAESTQEAGLYDRPFKKCTLLTLISREASTTDRPNKQNKLYVDYDMLSFAWLPHDVCVCSIEIADEGKMGLGFTSADDLEAIDIGPGDKSRPTFISKRLSPELKDP